MTTASARVRAQASYEARTLLSNGEQLLVSLLLPALALVGMALAHTPYLGPGRRIDLVVPGVLAMAVVSTAFTGQAIATGFDRRYGVLRFLGTTPLGRGGLLAGKALAVLTVVALQTVVLAALGLAFGWHPTLSGVLIAAMFMLLGTFCFVALGLLLAGALRAEAVLAVANLIWVLLVAVGGLLYPTARMPGVAGQLVRLLPSGALGDGLRAALTGHDLALAEPVLVLLVWGGLGTLLALRTFSWSD
ncbi:ABC transporter permease [Calidifontibacter sp. DB0510]|uniref:ABC transporter permease n=1 Tax=Metallococcus carri TaxID=1656884 RepID=A0A967B003_9MICO|nr:ABC transporter permease [Metallococcus carri]NHN54898.1 ABC transporter permease [Metallococcus carri]NOP37243.1 ABC transporter permease [Calidifontibacter sp. DB2511S]